jgi:hypothetical protein
MTTARIAATLRRAVQTSDFAPWGECLAPDALLDASVCGRHFRSTGPERIVADHHSMYPRPHAVHDWREMPTIGGLLIEFKRRQDNDANRRYAVALGIEAGRVTEEVVYGGRWQTREEHA